MGHGGRRIEAILIAGPTASGKSALALRLAERLGGTIVNADSMQIYRDLRVLTARPSPADEARVPHRLYGTVDGAETYSVRRWLDDVAAVMARERADGRLPIVVGGTGLFFKALTQGLSDIPPVPDAIRAEVRGWAEVHGAAVLHARLAARDPDTASRLRPTDPQRVSRALEVLIATGRGLTTFHETREPPLLPLPECLALTLTPDRETSRRQVDDRVLRMLADGATLEIAALAARRLAPDLPVMRAIGVPPLLGAHRGDLDLESAVATMQRDSRQYLKRQTTFLRHQLPAFRAIEPDRAEAYVLFQSA